MAVNTEISDRPTPRGRAEAGSASECCCVCDKELNDEEALIVPDYEPVDFLDAPRLLKGYEIRCEHCIALLPECPMCKGLMNECPTCGAYYCRGHAIGLADSADEPTALVTASLCDFCGAIHSELGASATHN